MHNASSIVGPKQVSSGIFGLVILDLDSLQRRLHTKRIYFLFAFCKSGSVVGPYICVWVYNRVFAICINLMLSRTNVLNHNLFWFLSAAHLQMLQVEDNIVCCAPLLQLWWAKMKDVLKELVQKLFLYSPESLKPCWENQRKLQVLEWNVIWMQTIK